MRRYIIVIIVLLLSTLPAAFGQEKGVNYDESSVGEYQLPALLITEKGRRVKSARKWMNVRRPEVLQLFQENVYGKFPGKPASLHFELKKTDSTALSGIAVSKQIRIHFTDKPDGPYMDVLLYLPQGSKKPVPVFTGLNFMGNQAVNADPEIEISQNYLDYRKNIKKINSEKLERGEKAGRWQAEKLIERGYGLATAYYGDLEQDHALGWKTGVRTSLEKELGLKASDWSGIGAWAWGLSRILDYLETDEAVDASKVIVMGHSRLGKTALWAGANDTRFAAVISNNSGEGGAALTRRWFGETTDIITNAFPHWFISKYKSYIGKTDSLPVDQHMLLALTAPRPLYVASASEDQWADPKGEFLSAKYAEPVYNLFGKKGLRINQMPPINHPVGKTIRYHIRTGKHEVLLYDWLQYLDFADEEVLN